MQPNPMGAYARTAPRPPRRRSRPTALPGPSSPLEAIADAEAVTSAAPAPSSLEAIADADALARARHVLDAEEVAGGEVLDRTGRRRSPITQPEFRRGRAPANKGRTYPVEPLTGEEMQALLDAFPSGPRSAHGARSRALVVVLWRAGLRIAEALALLPKDLDLERGMITVLRGKGAKRRVVGIDRTAVEYLREWWRHREALGIPDDRPVFCTCSRDVGGLGRPMGSAAVREQLKSYGRKAGITKRVHPHGLRHTHAFELSMESTPLNVIRAQLGHKSLAMTAHYCDHLTGGAQVQAMSRREWPGGTVPPATTRAAASQSARIPLSNQTELVAAASPLPRTPAAAPVPKLPHGGGVPGEAKARILEVVKANGGRATQAQLAGALRVRNVVIKRHCEQLAAAGHLVRLRIPRSGSTPRRSAPTQDVRGQLVVWMLPPLKAIYQLDPRVELGRRARSGHGRARVLDAIKAAGGRASQAQIAGVLGVTTDTVAKHAQRLEAEGKLERGGLDHSTANRGSRVWSVPSSERYSTPPGQRLSLGGVSSSSTARRVTPAHARVSSAQPG